MRGGKTQSAAAMLAESLGMQAARACHRSPYVTAADFPSATEVAQRLGSIGAFEHIESGPTPSEIAAVESLVESRSSRCMTGRAALSCGTHPLPFVEALDASILNGPEPGQSCGEASS